MPRPHDVLRPAVLAAILALLAPFAPSALAQGDGDVFTGTWEGSIGPGSVDLGVVVRVATEDGERTGTIDIPAQGLRGGALEVREARGDAIVFALPGVPGEPMFDGTVAGDALRGTFTQGGRALPFELNRVDGPASELDEAPRRTLPLQPSLPHGEDGFAGTWSGRIESPQGILEVIVRLREGPDGWAGTIDVPAQGAADVPLRDLDIGATRGRFTIDGIPGEQTFDGQLVEGGERIEGDFTAYGREATFVLERGTDEEVADTSRRPQDPLPPLPYDEVEVVYEGPAGAIAGTLAVPEGEGPFPAVLLISGSGAQDRDSTLMGHRPFLVLADALARAGIASLRADDRGVGGTEGNLLEARYGDLVRDAAAGLRTLARRPEVDATRVGVIGHSEGGYLAPMVAAHDEADPAFLVLLAAPAVNGLEVLRLQNRLLLETSGADARAVDAQVAFLDAWGEAVRDGDLERAREATMVRVREQYADVPPEGRPSEAEIELIAQRTAAANNSPYMLDFVLHEPGPFLSALDVPTLAVYGRQDVQVPAVQSAGRMSGHLRVAGLEDAEVVTVPGANHLLQPATVGGLDEYATIPTTIDPQVLELVTDWIGERFGR